MRVIIAHRNAAAGHGLALLLAKYGDFDVVGEIADPDEIVATIVNANPNLALVDSEFPSIDGGFSVGPFQWRTGPGDQGRRAHGDP